MLLSKPLKHTAEMIHFDLHCRPWEVGTHTVPTLQVRTPGHRAVKGLQLILDVGSVATRPRPRPPPPTQGAAYPVGLIVLPSGLVSNT